MMPESDMAQSIAIKQGLSKEQILVISNQGRITSTVEEALALRSYFKTYRPKVAKLIFVTSWYHSRRAEWILEKVFSDTGIVLEMQPVRDVSYSSNDWWKSEDGMITVFVEYAKWLRYLGKYAGRSL
jgi:uncharacterized SAM-binding protein YcdF (DUF218 family)